MLSPGRVESPEGSVLFLLERAAGYLADRGVEPARLDAELLLGCALGVDRLTLYLRFDSRPSLEQVDTFRELVRKRAAGMPTAYLTGKREFWSLEFEVNQAALIPRPETETLVEAALAIWPSGDGEKGLFLDLGTGCGNLAVALAREWKGACFVALDVSAGALRLAARNAARQGVSERVWPVRGDWMSALRRKRAFRGVICNPPYIAEAEFEGLPREVRCEPRLALHGGRDGLRFFRALAAGARALIADGGWLLVEVGSGQASAVRSIWEEAGLRETEVSKDLAGIERVVAGRVA